MSVTHRSLSVAVESLFGSLSPSTGLPDNSGLTYVSIPCERDPIIIYGDPVVSERTDARDGTYSLPPEPDTVWSGGSRVRRRTGQVTLRLDLTTVGTGSAAYTTNYLGYLLGGGFRTVAGTLQSDTVAVYQNANQYTPTATSTDYTVGSLLGVNLNGRAEYGAITDDDVSGDVTFSPAFSANYDGQTVYSLQTWYPGQRTQLGTTAHSVSFRVDGVGFRSYAYGCRLESMQLSLDNGRVMADLTYQAALIQDDHGAAVGPIEPVYNSGAPCFFRGSYAVISSTSPTSLTDASSTGDTLGRIALDVDDFTLTVTNTLTPQGHSNSILAMSDMEVSDVDVELSLTLSTINTTINNDFFNRTLRQVVIGFGPLGLGQGGAFMLPAAYLTTDPSKYDPSGNDITRQQLTYKASRFGGDIADTSETYNTPFRIGLGRQA